MFYYKVVIIYRKNTYKNNKFNCLYILDNIMKTGGSKGCAVAMENGHCNKFVLDANIDPTKHTVLDTLQRDYSTPTYSMPNIGNINPSYSSFGMLSTGGGKKKYKKIDKKIIEKVLKKLSNRYLKNLKTNIRDVIKKESK